MTKRKDIWENHKLQRRQTADSAGFMHWFHEPTEFSLHKRKKGYLYRYCNRIVEIQDWVEIPEQNVTIFSYSPCKYGDALTKLEQIRKQTKTSRKKLSHGSGVEIEKICEIERGKHSWTITDPEPWMVKSIAEYLGVAINDIFVEETHQVIVDVGEMALHKIFIPTCIKVS